MTASDVPTGVEMLEYPPLNTIQEHYKIADLVSRIIARREASGA
jgi:hypothetical protein